MNRDGKERSNDLECSSGEKSGMIRGQVWYYRPCCTHARHPDDAERTAYDCYAKSSPNLPERIC